MEEFPHGTLIEAWRKTNQVTREALLTGNTGNQDSKASLMFITTYNSANPNIRELISKQCSYLGRSSATRELCSQDIMVTYRKPSSMKDMLVRAKIPQPRTTTSKGCTRPSTCQYCTRLSQSGKITNLNNNTTYNTITKGTCQSNNLTYCLECKFPNCLCSISTRQLELLLWRAGLTAQHMQDFPIFFIQLKYVYK